MKTLTMFLFVLLISCAVIAQETGKGAVVAAVNMNVLYRGVDNPVEIAVPGISSDKITATVSDGTINKTSKGWSVQPGSMSTLVITVLNGKDKVGEKSFRIKAIPNPVAVFAGKYEGSIDRERATNTIELNTELKDFVWDLNFRIVTFKFVCSKGAFLTQPDSNGNRLTNEMVSAIAELKSGDKFSFEDIKAVGPDGKTKMLNSIILQIQ